MIMPESNTKTRIQKRREFSEKYFEGIMSSIPSSVLIVDRNTRVLFANSNFYTKAKRTETDTIGKPITEIFPKVLLDYTNLTDKIKRIFNQKEVINDSEMEYRASGLSTRTYYYRLTPLENIEGSVENVILLMDDVTDRKRLGEQIKRTEEHLAQVVDSANDIIVSTEPSGKIISWNSTIEKITGFNFRDVKGKPFTILLAEEDHNSFLSIVHQLLKKKKVRDREFSVLNRESVVVDILWSFSAMHNENGNVIGFVIVGHDLTERKELQTKLIQSAKMVSLGTMAGGIAHEIRNPLAIIDSAAQILKKHSENEEIRNLSIEKIRNATNRAANIVDDLLKFAHQSEFTPEKFDFNELVENTLKLIKNQLSIQHIKVEKNYDSELPLVRGNKNQIQQVIINLLLNSCKSFKKTGTIWIQTKKVQNILEIKIKDNGSGIPEKDLPMIFDPFFTTQPIGKGTGLGLSVTYGIIKQHNGTIEVSNRTEKGTVFTITIPIESGNQTDDH